MELISRAKYDPKQMYKYINNQKKIKDTIPCLISNGVNITEPKNIVNCLNEQFYSVYSSDSAVFVMEKRTNAVCDQVDFSVYATEKIIQKLDKGKAIGTDGVSPYVLRECVKSLSFPLSLIFKISFECGKLPIKWKEANVTPIFKNKGKRSEPINYRPISLTSVVCKIMEKLVKTSMMIHLEEHKLLSTHQHGFVKNKSCITNLLESIDVMSEALNRGFQAIVIFLDFAKAFD